ncbi:hypothetical protein D8X55_02190 [Malacoplasma penetrans]|uniref:Histidine kinase/HSP90-like ATPase domain-containing protein n=1 Tax=Malacoplasma penetrans (strain HF-2) TaxID=272633 RepID=Q8EUE6_MALP2|nr:ATP-binding protein [Malacoplasma penetrans]RXY96824.1 hypothetical protein D8X55_02190 [Malacoplasma penetrans]BAC44769.1 hypothetical protein [Malacoplasma penetrans HF-2]
MKEKFNIQPEAGILSVFSRLNYKVWYAIAEFVDNSTASFYENYKTMSSEPYNITKLSVHVTYNDIENTLTIQDDAFGMDLADFKKAILLDQKPQQIGRNEFGMGLKTAASWFGNTWTVSSTRLGSDEEYFTEVNISKMKTQHLNEIEIETKKVHKNKHGTTITIYDLTKKISGTTKGKVKEILSSMYRRDIKNGKINIYYDGEKLEFHDFDVLEYQGKEWKKEINFNFEFSGNKYNVTGFVGILSDKKTGKGSYKNAGFALFRYGRIILGGPDLNYKPKEIFQQSQSQISIKLFGELNMEDFPVNQAKDGFIWDDGLEEEFLKELKLNILDYIKIAKLSKSERISDDFISDESSDEIQKSVQNVLDSVLLTKQNDDKDFQKDNKEIEEFEKMQEDYNNSAEETFSKPRFYNIPINGLKESQISVIWKNSPDRDLFTYDSKKEEIYINLNHPFFKPFSTSQDFKVLLDGFVISYIYAEKFSIYPEKEYLINKYDFLQNLNSFLYKFGRGKK